MALPSSSPVPTPTIRGVPRPLARALEAYADRLDVDLIRKAYDVAVECHAGQVRASGEEYVSHTVEVATILAGLRLDTSTIVAGLVHDVVEDTALTLRELEERFGSEVSALVDGVTKIGKVRFRSHTEQQVENYRKLLLSMAEDARVILIKLADRLHNMRTLEHLPDAKRRRIARETREIYAPLAHRLGIFSIKWELEDLSFKFLEPEVYDDLTRKIQQRRKERERHILELRAPLEEELRRNDIPAEVTGRPKHLWSIYNKMRKRGLPYEEIYDLMAMRIITDSIQHCYAALGVIHSRWAPVQERFHDYIATPKSNMYRSLHTTVVGPAGRRYEIQIRTEEMHRLAEYGIAAHWKYKEGGGGGRDEVDEALTWFRQVLEWQQDTNEPEEFMEFLRMDLFQGEIFVFTPKGEVKQLPTGATPIDFAFAVHTEVGLHCAGAKVNGRIAPLSRELRNGDSVEIMTNGRQWPNRDWLAFVKTSRARGRIRQWIRKQEFDSAAELGREFFDRELRKARRDRPSDPVLARAAEELGYPDFAHVHAALGRGDVGPTAVLRALFPGEDPAELRARTPSTLQRLAERLIRTNKGVRIQGMENLMVRYSQCCQPVPGDDVIGYVTRGRGVSIHRADCPNILNLPDPERRIDIEWAAEKEDRFMVRVYMRGTDRRGLLSDVAKAITDTGTDIQHADMRSVDGGMNGEFVVEVKDLAHLKKVLRSIGRVKGVLSVERRESFQETDLTL
ncbi:MAG: bifunctional (p)ppGpp synthetase/guanosine-3',5'-bis(diphosphate) 3'-pyrophosphohydrolase [Gemmatimonadetes bacterium]|nr:bifunctional (p)ppGpp synthetase/guanosine-3',5'-bis(diphosphate) 3'-pyrophosphohydrolase [Gemmatimonadota bacterium]NNK64119.1 bifunctional (p)ppGpp synthetase/guanosine-3',5'-bis(diphosphate) 3'-pyrophosphohydrolase [Gemmatimonadota bacterium]